MTDYQRQLVAVLRDVYVVESAGADSFLLRPSERRSDRSVNLNAAEADVAAQVTSMSGDALEALGAVGEDSTGRTAAVGLLAIHIEELIESDEAVARVEVTPTGLRALRAEP